MRYWLGPVLAGILSLPVTAADYLNDLKALSDAGVTSPEAVSAVLRDQVVTPEDVARARAMGIHAAIVAELAMRAARAARPAQIVGLGALDGPNRDTHLDLLRVLLADAKPAVVQPLVGPVDALRAVCVARLGSQVDPGTIEAAQASLKTLEEKCLEWLTRGRAAAAKEVAALNPRDALALLAISGERYSDQKTFPGKEWIPAMLVQAKRQIDAAFPAGAAVSLDVQALLVRHLGNLDHNQARAAGSALGWEAPEVELLVTANAVCLAAAGQQVVVVPDPAPMTRKPSDGLIQAVCQRLSLISLHTARERRLGDLLVCCAAVAGADAARQAVIRWQCLGDADRRQGLPGLLQASVLPAMKAQPAVDGAGGGSPASKAPAIRFLSAWTAGAGVAAFAQTYGERWTWACPAWDFQGLPLGPMPTEQQFVRSLMLEGPIPDSWQGWRGAIPGQGWTHWELAVGRCPFRARCEYHAGAGRVFADSGGVSIVLPAGTELAKPQELTVYVSDRVETVSWPETYTERVGTGKQVLVAGQDVGQRSDQGYVMRGSANGMVIMEETKAVQRVRSMSKQARVASMQPIQVP